MSAADMMKFDTNRPVLGVPPPCLFGVAQICNICNLLYRRFVIGNASETSSALAFADAPQNAILRYSRLQICATLNTRTSLCP